MNKKLNTFFLLVAITILNIIIMLILLACGLLIIAKISQYIASWLFVFLIIPILFICIAATVFINHQLILFLSKKIDINKYFTPIFKHSNKGTNKSNK
jgi:hypothetical protein